MIEVDGLNYEVAGTAILHQVGLALEPGGITALIGPNGAGKSSLLHCMAGLNRPVAGRVRIDGLDPFTAPGEERARAVALLQQSPVVVSRLKVRDLVAFGRWPLAASPRPPRRARCRAGRGGAGGVFLAGSRRTPLGNSLRRPAPACLHRHDLCPGHALDAA